MAYTTEWKVVGIRKQNTENLSDVIVGTHWSVKITDESGFDGTFTGATPFKLSEVDPGNFTQYSELTQEQVLGWVKNEVSGSNPKAYWGHILERAYEQINEKKYSRVSVEENNLPWSPTSGSQAGPTVGPNA